MHSLQIERIANGVCFEILFVALSAIVLANNLGTIGKNINMAMIKKRYELADFILLFLQNEDVLLTKQHTQERQVSDLSGFTYQPIG